MAEFFWWFCCHICHHYHGYNEILKDFVLIASSLPTRRMVHRFCSIPWKEWIEYESVHSEGWVCFFIESSSVGTWIQGGSFDGISSVGRHLKEIMWKENWFIGHLLVCLVLLYCHNLMCLQGLHRGSPWLHHNGIERQRDFRSLMERQNEGTGSL